ncbi:MAG: hypothetical protein IPG01_03710 [Chitinophagaceae bacterium]|nr:hypothetical protein [Chitinophagaceae bacterium]
MSTIELKQRLIEKIQVTDDNDILNGLLKLLEFELNATVTYKLNAHQKESIAISREQITKGEVYTEDEVNKLTDEWLKE